MRGSELYELELYCRDIVGGGDKFLKWDWDADFRAVVSPFFKKDKNKIFNLLRKNFLTCWNSKNIKKAPSDISAIAEALGGVRDEQKLFISDPDKDILIFGAWWPWSGKDTISIRIGIVSVNLSENDEVLLFKEFRRWFGL